MFWYFIFIINSATADYNIRNVSMVNWTTCEGFLKNYTHDENKLVDIDWKIFYFWDDVTDDSYNVRFSKPTQGLIDRYRVELSKEMRDVNWNDSALFMETSIDFSALYMRTNKTAIYRLIPSLAFEVPNCPYMTFALKVVDPGYLGIMNCKSRLAFALAPVEKLPDNDHLVEAASRLMFWNNMGRSYMTQPTQKPQTRYEDDDIDDAEMEIENNFNAL